MERERGRERVGRQREHPRDFTLFIDNLPKDLDNFGLRGIFMRFGSITDAYIPRKTGQKSGRRYGFVRFCNKGSAEEALKKMNKRHIRGMQIETYWARFQKRKIEKRLRQSRRPERNSKPRHKPQEDANQVQPHNNDGFLATIEGEICEDTLEWLRRSLVCKSKHPLAVESLEMAIKIELPNCLKVTDMGCFKAILTFDSLEEAITTLHNHSDILEYWFDEFKPWDELEFCETRQAWLELYGIPGHGWSRSNIEKVVSCWGELACVDYDTMEVSSFKVARALIDTTQMKTIEGDVLLTLGMQGYRVSVRETSSPANLLAHANHKTISIPNHFHEEDDQHSVHGEESLEVPDSQQPQRKADDEPQIQILGLGENDQPDGDVAQSSSSRTHSDPLLKPLECIEARVHLIPTPTAQIDNDSEATVGVIYGAQHGEKEGLVNANTPFQDGHEVEYTPLAKSDSEERSFNEILEDFEESWKSKKSKKKKAKRLTEKCRSIQKEINSSDFIKKAQHAWEVSKAIGLASKNQDAKVVEIIARNMALEALERKN